LSIHLSISNTQIAISLCPKPGNRRQFLRPAYPDVVVVGVCRDASAPARRDCGTNSVSLRLGRQARSCSSRCTGEMKALRAILPILIATGLTNVVACDLCGCYTPQLNTMPQTESR